MIGALLQTLDYAKTWPKSAGRTPRRWNRPRNPSGKPTRSPMSAKLIKPDTTASSSPSRMTWRKRKARNAVGILFGTISLMAISACSLPTRTVFETETEVVEVPVTEIVPVPEVLTRYHEIPEVHEGMTYGELEEAALECVGSLLEANADKSAIRKLKE